MTQYLPNYTSMECIKEQDPTSWDDEPYAIFLGVNWTTSPVRWFVKRTKVYTNVDEGEKHGAYYTPDDRALTSTGKYQVIDPSHCFILMQAMEYDNSSPTFICKALKYFMGKRIPQMSSLFAQKPLPLKSNVLPYFKESMSTIIKIARHKPTLSFVDTIIKGFTYDLLDALINPDDMVGGIKELTLTGGDRKEITCTSSGNGKYIYKFSIHKK